MGKRIWAVGGLGDRMRELTRPRELRLEVLGCGCLLALIGMALAVPVAILVVVGQGAAKRKAKAILTGERPATTGDIDDCLRSLGGLHDAESIELVRRLTVLRLDGHDEQH